MFQVTAIAEEARDAVDQLSLAKGIGGSNGQGEDRQATRHTNLISLGSQLKVKMADMTFGS